MPYTKGQGGRPKGVPNKLSGELKGMILQALSEAGGVEYLTRQAVETPTAFLSLVGRVLPLQVTDGAGQPVIPPRVTLVFPVQEGSENRT